MLFMLRFGCLIVVCERYIMLVVIWVGWLLYVLLVCCCLCGGWFFDDYRVWFRFSMFSWIVVLCLRFDYFVFALDGCCVGDFGWVWVCCVIILVNSVVYLILFCCVLLVFVCVVWVMFVFLFWLVLCCWVCRWTWWVSFWWLLVIMLLVWCLFGRGWVVLLFVGFLCVCFVLLDVAYLKVWFVISLFGFGFGLVGY